MDIREEINKYSDLISLEVLEERVKTVLSISDEQPEHFIPSIILGTDGPILFAILFITQNYLGEIRLQSKELDFDFVNIKSVTNHRFMFWEQPVSKADGTTVIFEMANVTLIHNVSSNFSSEISYAGSNRSAWIDALLKAIPLKLLVASTM